MFYGKILEISHQPRSRNITRARVKLQAGLRNALRIHVLAGGGGGGGVARYLVVEEDCLAFFSCFFSGRTFGSFVFSGVASTMWIERSVTLFAEGDVL